MLLEVTILKTSGEGKKKESFVARPDKMKLCYSVSNLRLNQTESEKSLLCSTDEALSISPSFFLHLLFTPNKG